MNERWIRWALAQRTGGSGLKGALIGLALHAGHDGRGKVKRDPHPGGDRGRQPGRSLKTRLEELENRGFIYVNIDDEISFRLLGTVGTPS